MKLFIFAIMILFNNTEDFCPQKKDTVVIRNYYKIIEHGNICFLIKSENTPYKQIVFSYDINIDKKQADIVLLKEEYISSVKDVKSYVSSKKWNSKQIGTFREKYYKVIDDNFLRMTNSAKIDLLKKLAK